MAPEQVMEGMTEVKIPPRDDIAEITRSSRDLPPAHYTYKIENFSLFSLAKIDNVESGDFVVDSYKWYVGSTSAPCMAGLKWRLCLYPDGNKKSKGDGHVSLYLVFSDSNALPFGWEVNVNFRLFIYNQINDKYLTIQYANGRARRFHGLKTVLGFDHLLPLSIFNDESKGYLIDDRCIFGAEISVIKPTGKGECLSMVKEPVNSTFTWKIQNFSALDKKSLKSQVFSFGGHKWTLLVYPKGNSTEEGKSLSIFLAMEDSETLPSGRTTYALYMLRVRDQLFGKKHFEKEANCHFSNSIKDWGHLNFMPLDDVNALPKGFLVNDTLAVEVQIHGITVAKEFS